MKIYKYRVYCTTESAYVYTWGTTAPTVCPNSGSHVLDLTSTSIFETVQDTDVSVSNFNADAFARLRVSNPQTMFDLHHTIDKNPLLVDEIVTGTATSTFTSPGSYVAMTVTATSDRVVRQSKEYISYQPGKSKLVFMTGVLETSGGKTGVICRIGMFDDNIDKTVDTGGDGFFFELNGTTMNVVERSYITGTQVDTKIAQSSWNYDALDGTGPSGLTVTDWSNSFIFVMDQEWLGVGRVRMGIVRSNTIYYVHNFDHNTLKTPYNRTAKLPIRYEISRTSGTGLATMRMICSSVISEGGYAPQGLPFSYAMSASRSVTSSAVLPLLSIRLKSTYNRITIRIQGVDVLQSSNNNLVVYVISNGTLTGASYSSVSTNSGAEVDISATAISGGDTIITGFNTDRSVFTNNVNVNLLQYGINATIAGTSDIITVAAKSLGTTSSVYVSIDFIEYRL